MLQEVKNECIAKWAENGRLDKRLQFFSDKYDEWVNQIPEEYKELALRLLKELHYFTKQKTNAILYDLHSQLLEKYKITNDDTIYAFIKSSDGKTNSSNDYWTEYKNINEISKEICFEDLSKINLKQWGYINNIVFIDDFSGTGKSIIKELDKHKVNFENKNVFIVVISLMAEAKKALENYGRINNINIACIFGECRNKIFEQVEFKADKGKYNLMTDSLLIKWPLGYEETQSLIALYNNTPNNTLGFIHNESKKYTPIFPRIKDYRPKWQQMSDAKKNRKAANYNNSKI